MALKEYRKKRDFKKTPEPYGKVNQRKKKLLYIIQKHAASHLHYDFRLELDGVLKSWAVPKGPSLDPTVKHLAIHVEDHPYEYGSFEGTIPQREYGGGTVMLWDKGEWIPQDKDVHEAYKKGSMTFLLKGKKLKGLWKLVQIKTDPKNWLLMKIDDKYARPITDYDITVEEPLSAISEKNMEEIAGNKKVWRSNRSTGSKKKLLDVEKLQQVKKAKFPEPIHPQLATLVNKPPRGENWLHEIKFDGYRIIAFIKKNKVTLMTRRQQDWTKKYQVIAEALEKLKLGDVVLDGEVVAIDENNQFSFQLLQNAADEKKPPFLAYYIFDIIYYHEFDTTKLTQIERKNLLEQILPPNNQIIRYSDHVIGDGEKIFKQSCEIGLEGIISKNIGSTYVFKRSKDWLKSKCVKRQEFVVGGYTQPRGKRKYFGALLIGIHSAGTDKLTYCGHVGTGFNEKSLEQMWELLSKYQSTEVPFVKRPPMENRPSWVEPKIVVEIEFTEWTSENVLRHPSFKGIRLDKTAGEVTKEIPQPMNKKTITEKKSFSITHPERILYPEENITKLDIANYYDSVKEWIMPYIRNRPLTLVRCPESIDKPCFFQRHIHEDKPDSIYVFKDKQKGKTEEYFYIKAANGLMELIQLSAIEIHPWGCQVDNLEHPDVIVFDLDPAPDVKWKKVVDTAFLMKYKLAEINLQSFLKTTGGKGLHVVVPIKPIYTWEEVTNFAHAFIDVLVTLHPKDYIGKMTKSKRTGKIFLDYLRNQRSATAIAPYAVRARKNATVATPLHWHELNARMKPSKFTIKTVSKRLSKLKNDPWEEFFKLKQKIKFLKNL